MLAELIRKGLIGKKNLLMLTYKKAGLTEAQVMIVMMIMTLHSRQDLIINPATLADFMNLSAEDIDTHLEDMVEKRLVKITHGNINFSPLFERLAMVEDDDYVVGVDLDLARLVEENSALQLDAKQKQTLATLVANKLSKQQILDILTSDQFVVYADLHKALAKKISASQKITITRFNWLDE